MVGGVTASGFETSCSSETLDISIDDFCLNKQLHYHTKMNKNKSSQHTVSWDCVSSYWLTLVTTAVDIALASLLFPVSFAVVDSWFLLLLPSAVISGILRICCNCCKTVAWLEFGASDVGCFADISSFSSASKSATVDVLLCSNWVSVSLESLRWITLSSVDCSANVWVVGLFGIMVPTESEVCGITPSFSWVPAAGSLVSSVSY